METSGLYFDGRQAADRVVTIRLEAAGLRFSGSDTPPQLWPMGDLAAIEPPQRGHALRLTCRGQSGARLVIHDDDLAAALAKAAPQLGGGFSLRQISRGAAWVAGGIAVIVAILYLVLQLAPQLLAGVMPDRWRDTVGGQVEASLADGARQCNAAAGQSALGVMIGRFAEGLPGLPPISVKVYDIPVMNAFAMPGDRILITRELIDRAQSPDEVAGVLAHELGHVIGRHSEAQIIRATGLQTILGLLTGGSNQMAGSIAGIAALLRYSRSAEAEADDFALAALAAARIDPMGLKRFFETILKDQGKPSTGAMGRIGTALSTHPGTAERVAKIRPLPEGSGASPALTSEQWQALKKICSG